ncbi:hypothetical protein SODALDRAFT_316163 [Sodiomyces alkalinus F11]|uniref:Zn(2)-C6 fungal-type domain-containing protein n=1 Tax=Sodiomyces alkalinus (strain CBS 110278 / VKM F-3762 / F11) TaxID=1314773 RepID=A0A3N2PN20_SODAK|nr:hypothetical protein SODALDRAFT_316163 [Sodiomyces alkalinus F11]ROT35918.1 hypothetical protein SODALDRAFT_316163 [Sodiomyces alkalinus F11]
MSRSPLTASYHSQSGTPGTGTEIGAGVETATSSRSRSRSPPLPWQSPGTSATAAPTGSGNSRRSHPKSRTGCRTCKTRKIKCDEQKPACRNCVKHAVLCDFLQSHPVSASAPVPVPQSSAGAFGPSISDGLAAASSLPGESLNGLDGDLNMLDLELMHNFTSFTYATLSSDGMIRNMFRTDVVRMAFVCDYVMRSLLAVSALHLAHFRPDRRDFYVNRAVMHHRAASQSAVPLLTQFRPGDCESLYLFSILTIYFALGYPHKPERSFLIGEAAFPQWLFLLRNIEPILCAIDPITYRGPLAPLFAHGAHPENQQPVLIRDPRSEETPRTLLGDLERLVAKTCTEPDLIPIYHTAIGHLRRILGMVIPCAPNGDWRATQQLLLLDVSDVFVWQWTVADDLLPLLKGQKVRQEAVAIFAHFLILIKKLESQWWLEGWTAHLMRLVWTSLDQEHRLWIQWPAEEMGWVPPP